MTTDLKRQLPLAQSAIDALERVLPGLPETLQATPLRELESDGNPGIPAFKEAGGPGLLIRRTTGGTACVPATRWRCR